VPYIGLHNMILEVTLDRYGQMLQIDFKIQISGCAITAITISGPASFSFTYDILSPAVLLQMPIPPYSVSPPDC